MIKRKEKKRLFILLRGKRNEKLWYNEVGKYGGEGQYDSLSM
jgi:hypothetical protein